MNFKIYKNKLSFLLLLLVTLFVTNSANAQSTASKSYADVQKEQQQSNKTVTPVMDKKQQAEQFNLLCPHYPVSNTPGANKETVLAFETWKKSYPEEYAAYLKIFKLKQ